MRLKDNREGKNLHHYSLLFGSIVVGCSVYQQYCVSHSLPVVVVEPYRRGVFWVEVVCCIVVMWGQGGMVVGNMVCVFLHV